MDPGRLGEVARSRHIARQLLGLDDGEQTENVNVRTMVLILGSELAGQTYEQVPGTERLKAWVVSDVCSSVMAALNDLSTSYPEPIFKSLSLGTVKKLLALHPGSPPDEIDTARAVLAQLFSNTQTTSVTSPGTVERRRLLDEMVELRARELLERMSLSSSATNGHTDHLHRTTALRRHRRPGSTSSNRSLRLTHHRTGSKKEPRHKKLAKKLGLTVVIGLPRADKLRAAAEKAKHVNEERLGAAVA